MAWTKVAWHSLGFNIVDKQCCFYYGLEGDNNAHEVYVTAPQLSALAEMFRDQGPVAYDADGHCFVTNHQMLAISEVISAPPQPDHLPA